jgi:undecaprenyl-diphosphatase
MDILQAIILGIVQGITEWLPISSSGHLVILEDLFKISQPLAYDLLLHLGSLLVVIYVFRKDIRDLIIGCIQRQKDKLLLLGYLIIATIPIAIVGYFFNDVVKSIFADLRTVGFGLLFTALLLFLSQYPTRKYIEKLNWHYAAFIGFFQAIAILPGVSRSGSTIGSGLMMGVKREEITRFSFLLFIPAITGATILELKDLEAIPNIGTALIGVLFSIIVGVVALKWLIDIVKKGKIFYFSIYCLILGLAVLSYYYLF